MLNYTNIQPALKLLDYAILANIFASFVGIILLLLDKAFNYTIELLVRFRKHIAVSIFFSFFAVFIRCVLLQGRGVFNIQDSILTIICWFAFIIFIFICILDFILYSQRGDHMIFVEKLIDYLDI